MNFEKFLIWFFVLKSTHQDASFEMHKSLNKKFILFFALAIFFNKSTILHIEKSKCGIFWYTLRRNKFLFALAFFFYKSLLLHIQKTKFWIFFFGFLFTGPIYNFILPRVSIFVIFFYYHTAYWLYIFGNNKGLTMWEQSLFLMPQEKAS